MDGPGHVAAESPAASAPAFAWPPKQPVPSTLSHELSANSASAAAASPSWRQRVRDGVWALERAAFAPTSAPLARRIEACRWEPDAFGEFCDRCGETAGPHETGEFGCASCRDRSLPWQRFVRLGAHSGNLRDWVHELKFSRNASLGHELGRRLGARLRDAGVLAHGEVCIVPTPAHWSRRIARGVDHAGMIALGVAAELRSPLVHAVARRWGRSQRTASVRDRSRNVARAFVRRSRASRLNGRTVVLVDDVRTTGATLRSCSKALGPSPDPAGISAVWVAVVAVTSHVPVGDGGRVSAGVVHDRSGAA